jgi:transglutaminase-like putative cysteine protease
MTVFQIEHSIEYIYSQPVIFAPHQLRLRPRSNVHQSVLSFDLSISPTPQQVAESVDLDGNNSILVWFDSKLTTNLQITTRSTVSTSLVNPFNYLTEPWAANLPIDYPGSLAQQLQPYLTGYLGHSIDPVAAELAAEIWQTVDGKTIPFLSELNQQIYHNCQYSIRDTGASLPPGIVWKHRSGSCRDFVVLLLEVCRAVGLAGRFVSGYEAGAEPDDLAESTRSERHLHAWAEIYLPGAGWRGYDPTHGLLVADNHIALCSSPFPAQTTPVEGKLRTVGTITTDMNYRLMIEKT